MLEDISQKNVGLNPEAIKTFPRKISGKLYFYVSFSGIVHSIIVSNVDVIYAADALKMKLNLMIFFNLMKNLCLQGIFCKNF